MNCKHHWIGDTCCECGIAWHIYAANRIAELNNTINDLLDNGRTLLEQNEKLTAENERLRERIKELENMLEVYG